MFRVKRMYRNYGIKVFCFGFCIVVLHFMIRTPVRIEGGVKDKESIRDRFVRDILLKSHTDKKSGALWKSKWLQTNKHKNIWKPPNNQKVRDIAEESSIYSFLNETEKFCGGAFEGHAHLFAVLTDTLVNPSKGNGKIGGEDLTTVVNQTEEVEYYKLSEGYFNMQCRNKTEHTPYKFEEFGHLNHWMSLINFNSVIAYFPGIHVVNRATIFVQRYDYAHMYFTVLDVYNAFLVCILHGLDPTQTNIVWVDAHPTGGLDSLWNMLFGSVVRVGEIKEPVLFKTMIWNIVGRNGPINQPSLRSIPFLEEFRNFVLSSYNVNSRRQLDCSKVTVTLVWRRDYVAHPRNTNGRVVRKIKNEAQLLTHLRYAFPRHKINGYQLDTFPMQKQFRYISQTDVLIGMHGAGLTHALFLPPHGALIELFPTNYRPRTHYRDIAEWRGLRYAPWNRMKEGDRNKEFAYVEPVEIIMLVRSILRTIC